MLTIGLMVNEPKLNTDIAEYQNEEIKNTEINEPYKNSAVLIPEVKRICGCESVNNPEAEPRHFDKNGDVLMGQVNSKDIGGCQINLDHWGDDAKKLGLDVFIEEDNYKMANWIYENYGDWPWNWSKDCWNK